MVINNSESFVKFLTLANFDGFFARIHIFRSHWVRSNFKVHIFENVALNVTLDDRVLASIFVLNSDKRSF